VSYYVPPGKWTDLLTGKRVNGSGWVREQHGFDSVPALVRPGAVIAMGARDDRPNYDYVDGVTLRVYEPVDGARVIVSVPTMKGDAGAVFAISRDGRELRIERSGTSAPWHVLLMAGRTSSVSSGVIAPTPDGSRVDIEAGVATLTIVLD
jgi:alpha-D-xyloside xylohydrolase